MSIISGDNWIHSRNAPVVEGIEYFNYSNHDIIVTDRLGIEMEILRSTNRPERLVDRGKVIVRVTRVIDPRRVRVPNNESVLKCDQDYLVAFKEKLEQVKKRIGEYESEENQIRTTIQVEMHFDFFDGKTVCKSNLLGITIRESSNYNERSHGDSPEGYIENTIVKELEDIDHEVDEYVDKGVRTLFSARLIDNHNRIGNLWTSGFGKVTRVIPVKSEEQKEGLYLAGGLRLEHKQFIPIEELLDPKKLLMYNLHSTEKDARKHTTGEYTNSVTTENDKLKKERSDLKNENKKLADKVDDLEVKIKVEKINRAASDFKQAVAMEKVKEYGAENTVSGVTRLIRDFVASIKSVLGFIAVFKR
jgi:predicted  nucleic acid-binding Zn-ribbon protein